MATIAMIGAGGWGTAMAVMLSQNGHDVTMWSAFEEEIQILQRDREHKKLLAGVIFPDSLKLTCDLDFVPQAEIVVLAVPSFAVRKVCRQIKSYMRPEQLVVNIGKGLELDSLERLSEVIEWELAPKRLCVLCGPSHAEEVGRAMPTALVASAPNPEDALQVQEQFSNARMRIYTNPDVIGVELGAALKNVIAICAGMLDGMGYGDNAKAALMTRGISEIARLGVAMGARSETFAGLAGIGDLIVTCTSMHSRNRRAGILIGKGIPVQQALQEVNMVVEGYVTTKAAYDLSKRIGVEMPITHQAFEVLYQGKDPKQAVHELMTRTNKQEVEHVWLEPDEK